MLFIQLRNLESKYFL